MDKNFGEVAYNAYMDRTAVIAGDSVEPWEDLPDDTKQVWMAVAAKVMSSLNAEACRILLAARLGFIAETTASDNNDRAAFPPSSQHKLR